jgi:hypothetical protein
VWEAYAGIKHPKKASDRLQEEEGINHIQLECCRGWGEWREAR